MNASLTFSQTHIISGSRYINLQNLHCAVLFRHLSTLSLSAPDDKGLVLAVLCKSSTEGRYLSFVSFEIE